MPARRGLPPPLPPPLAMPHGGFGGLAYQATVLGAYRRPGRVLGAYSCCRCATARGEALQEVAAAAAMKLQAIKRTPMHACRRHRCVRRERPKRRLWRPLRGGGRGEAAGDHARLQCAHGGCIVACDASCRRGGRGGGRNEATSDQARLDGAAPRPPRCERRTQPRRERL